MKHAEFKAIARQQQIDFKVNDPEIDIAADRFPIRIIRKNGKEYKIEVRSSLNWKDCRDENNLYRIFFSGFRKEITEEVDKEASLTKGQMVTNLLRSEHIPYNVFFPMQYDLKGTARLFNRILGEERIATISKINIEYNPKGLSDGTSFDAYIEYTPMGANPGEKGGIGIEVKYTEKEYPMKRNSKEWNETHNAFGIHLADNYSKPSNDCGWFKNECLADVLFEDKDRLASHVVANRYRQIWRNHILGASMILGLSANPDDQLSEFTSLTVFPKDNGHFSEVWDEYESKLTPAGLKTFKHITYEELFPLMRSCLNTTGIPNLNEWIDYLYRRYIIEFYNRARVEGLNEIIDSIDSIYVAVSETDTSCQ
ncbi:MAG: hypothetical protein K2I11_00930, partial [Bacteroides sp.]|nr:hypothetical protein [Bacteroides sp.]